MSIIASNVAGVLLGCLLPAWTPPPPPRALFSGICCTCGTLRSDIYFWHARAAIGHAAVRAVAQRVHLQLKMKYEASLPAWTPPQIFD